VDFPRFFSAARVVPDLCRAALLVCALALGACSTVKPQDKELLADPAMSYGSGGEAELQEEHVLSNREGAAGAGRASGGGCGCN
jgi:Domain of unknown function (DUF4266)